MTIKCVVSYFLTFRMLSETVGIKERSADIAIVCIFTVP